MISFRYHLISVVAIFLALGLGVVVGTTALHGAVVGDLHRQVSDLKAQNKTAADQVAALKGAAGDADELATIFGNRITAGALANVGVVIVAAPSATPAMLTGVASAITSAGGKVTSQVQLTSAFTDPTRANDIRSLATTSAIHPTGLALPGTDDAGTLAGALLGYTLLGHGTATDLPQVVSGLVGLGMVKQPATLAAGKVLVLVASGAAAAGSPSTATLATMTTEMAIIGGATVVVGDAASATTDGLVGRLRADSTAKRAVSTVDDGETALGQLTTSLVVAEAVANRKGAYGTGAGADALLPGASS